MGNVKAKKTNSRKKASALRAGRRVKIHQHPTKRAGAKKGASIREKSRKMVKAALAKAAKALREQNKNKAVRDRKTAKTPNKVIKETKVASKVVAIKEVKEQLVYKPGDYVVYPTHGVGKVVEIESTEIAGHKLRLFV